MNAVVLVMFRKKFSQPWVEKFACSEVSNACGNGVGNTGATLGIVGTACAAGVVLVADVVAAAEADEEVVGGAVGKAKVDVPETCAWGAGSGCRLCGRQSVSEGFQGPPADEPDRTSRAAGCERNRVVPVIKISTNGTTRTAHLVRREVVRFDSADDDEVGESMSSVTLSTPGFSNCNLGGDGDGGGVNISG